MEGSMEARTEALKLRFGGGEWRLVTGALVCCRRLTPLYLAVSLRDLPGSSSLLCGQLELDAHCWPL